jgi:hypothetical protein
MRLVKDPSLGTGSPPGTPCIFGERSTTALPAPCVGTPNSIESGVPYETLGVVFDDSLVYFFFLWQS